MAKVKLFNSCFITDVEINDKMIILTDSTKQCFYIYRYNCAPETISSFEMWFKMLYLRGIPQTLTIVDYSIAQNEDGESIRIVNKLIAGTSILEKSSKKENA